MELKDLCVRKCEHQAALTYTSTRKIVDAGRQFYCPKAQGVAKMATASDTDDKGIDNFFVEGIQISELEDRVMIPFKNRNGQGDNVGGGDTQNDQAQSLSAFDVYMHSGFESIFVSEDTFSVNSGDNQDDRAQSVLARHACTWVVTTSCFICSFGLLPFGEVDRRFTAAGQM